MVCQVIIYILYYRICIALFEVTASFGATCYGIMVPNTSACRNVDMGGASIFNNLPILIKRGKLYINLKISLNYLKIMDSNHKNFLKKYCHVLYFSSDSDSHFLLLCRTWNTAP